MVLVKSVRVNFNHNKHLQLMNSGHTGSLLEKSLYVTYICDSVKDEVYKMNPHMEEELKENI